MQPGHKVAGALVLAAALAAARPARAIDPSKPLSAYTAAAWPARAGLPGSWVRAITQTGDGYLWISTYGGVGRYDGARIVTLPSEPPWSRLADVMAAKVDPTGVLWIIPAYGAPVCVRDGELRECLPSGVELPPGVRMADVHVDADGTVWLAARDRLFRFARARDRALVPVPTPAFSRARFLHRDRRGRLWLGTNAGLLREGRDGFALYGGPRGPVAAPVFSVFEDAEGVLWFAADGALLRVDGEAATLYDEQAGYPRAHPAGVIADRDGSIWIGQASGLTRLRDGRFVTFTSQDGLPDDDVTALFEDREGSLWVGTRTGGVAQFTDRTVATQAGPPSLRTLPNVESVCEDASGTLWVGFAGGLLAWRNGVERSFTEKDGLPSTEVFAVFPGKSAATGAETPDVWVGTQAGLAHVQHDHVERVAAAAGPVDALYVDDAGVVWMSLEGGLARLQQGQVERIPFAPGFAPGGIRGMRHDDQGKLWVVAMKGIARLDGAQVVDAGLPYALGTGRAVHRDAGGTLWFTTNAGLLRLAGGQHRLFGPAEGLTTPHLFQLLSDDDGFLWIGANNGIFRLSKRELDAVARGKQPRFNVVSLDVTDRRRDVSTRKYRQPGAWKDRLGRLWFASHQGLLTVDPRHLRVNDRAPAIRIDEALVDGRSVRPAGENEFPPGPGNLEFRFSAVTLLEPHKSLHRYRLEGFDERWVEAGPRRVAYYTNIAPGRYRFVVQGSNADGVWNQTGEAIAFRLRPHFYRTGWFYSLCALLLLATIALLHRARVRGLRRAYLAVFAERSRVARELHDTLLQGMSAVMLQIRGLRRRVSAQAPAVATDLEAIESVVGRSLQETRGVLGDLRGPAASGGDLGVALTRFADRIQDGRDVRCAVRVEGPAFHLPGDVESDLFRIGQEAVTNAFKHASATHVDLRLCYEKDVVRLTITDDGRGFDESSAVGAAQGHFGLLGMRERASRLGTFKLESRPGHGTTIDVTARLAGHAARGAG